jgi:hypothetical protein
LTRQRSRRDASSSTIRIVGLVRWWAIAVTPYLFTRFARFITQKW